MKFTRARAQYQQGSLDREGRKKGPDVWVFRWRAETPKGRVKRKIVVGTVEKYKTKAAAQKAVETLRMTINSETWMPSTLEELVNHYCEKELSNNKTPYTQDVYQGYLKTRILPTWGAYALHGVRTVKVEEWLASLSLSNGSKAKIRNIMHTIFEHGIRYEWIAFNPSRTCGRVQSVSVSLSFRLWKKSTRCSQKLSDPYRTMSFVAATTGLRRSELLGLKWGDFDLQAGVINLSRGVVRQYVGEMKTEASKKPLPLDPLIAAVLMNWRANCPYNQASDYVFASPSKRGTQPYWPNAAMEDHIKPAAKRAGITKRIGWHIFRHSVATLLNHNGADVKTLQELLRHSTSKLSLDVYTQAMTPAKRNAQSGITRVLNLGLGNLAPDGPTSLPDANVSV